MIAALGFGLAPLLGSSNRRTSSGDCCNEEVRIGLGHGRYWCEPGECSEDRPCVAGQDCVDGRAWPENVVSVRSAIKRRISASQGPATLAQPPAPATSARVRDGVAKEHAYRWPKIASAADKVPVNGTGATAGRAAGSAIPHPGDSPYACCPPGRCCSSGCDAISFPRPDPLPGCLWVGELPAIALDQGLRAPFAVRPLPDEVPRPRQESW
jgi:hypothetical protein